MTLKEYLEQDLANVVAELCQYQTCDNCSIGALFGRCPLLDMSPEDALDEEIGGSI